MAKIFPIFPIKAVPDPDNERGVERTPPNVGVDNATLLETIQKKKDE